MNQISVPFITSNNDRLQELWGILTGFMPENDYLAKRSPDQVGPVIKTTPESKLFVRQLLETCERPEFRQSAEILSLVLNAASQIFPYDASVRGAAEWFCATFPDEAPEAVKGLATRLTGVKPDDREAAICATMAEIENQFADEILTLQCGEVDAWPIIRSLFTKRLRTHLNGNRIRPTLAADTTRHIFRAHCSVFGHFHVPSVPLIHELETWQDDVTQADFLFFSHVDNYSKRPTRLGSESVGDFLCAQLSETHKCVRFEEISFKKTLPTYPRLFLPVFFQSPWLGSVDAYLTVRDGKPRLLAHEDQKRLEKFIVQCAETIGLTYDHAFLDILEKDFALIEAYAGYFRELLSGATARALFLDVDPRPEAMGLILACRSLGIPVVQLPGSPIGACHADYTHWLHGPVDGFNTQADVLWAHDETEKRRLQDAFAPRARQDGLFAGGHPKAEWLKDKPDSLDGTVSRYEDVFLTDLMDGQFTVLINFGNEKSEISVFAALAKTLGANARILVRLPASLVDQRDSIQLVFADNGLDNIECVFASVLPVELLLARCHHVLTGDTDFARLVLEYDVDLTLFGSPDAALWDTSWGANRFTICNDLPAVLKRLAKSAEAFADKTAWTRRLRELQDFRQAYLPRSQSQVAGPLADCLAERSGFRSRQVQLFKTSAIFTDTATHDQKAYTDWNLGKIPLPDRDQGPRSVVQVADDIVLNRVGIARVLTCAYSRLNQESKVDFVFNGPNVTGREHELLSVFSSMNAHQANVHLDATNADLLTAANCTTIPVTKAAVEGLADAEGVSLPHLTPSDDTLKHVQAWLDAQRFSRQTIALTFSDWLSPEDVSRILCSAQLQAIAAQKAVILNGSDHFHQPLVRKGDPLTLFEPGIYSIDAALALSRCVDVNVIISDDIFDMVFHLGGNNPMRVGVQDWQ